MLQRFSRSAAVTITNDAATTPEIPFHEASGGRIHIPTGSAITALTFYDAADLGGPYLASYDSAASPAAITISPVAAARSYPMPTDLFGARMLRIVGTFSAGTSGALVLSLKG